jgi:hypothetical protein
MARVDDVLKNLDEAKKLVAEINRIEGTELPEMKRRLAQIVSDIAPSDTTGLLVPTERRGPPEGVSRTQKVFWALKENKGKPMNAEEVSQFIGETDKQFIMTMLKRLADRKQVRKVDRGRYVFEG